MSSLRRAAVTAPRPRPDQDQPRSRDGRLAGVVSAGFAVVVGFQLSLVAGAPWGAAAYGGAEPGRLPTELRVVSAAQAGVWLLAALTAFARSGAAAPSVPSTLGRRATWAFTGLLGVGTVVNAASSSRWERFGWAPFLLVLTVLTAALARSSRTEEDEPPTRCPGAGQVRQQRP